MAERAPVIAIVTGSRDWTDEAAIRTALRSLPPGSIVYHGAARGADAIAARVASAHGLTVHSFPADWQGQGRKAGPIRNRFMRTCAKELSQGRGMPVVCLAFPLPQSKGTLDMIRLCEAEGWEVRRG